MAMRDTRRPVSSASRVVRLVRAIPWLALVALFVGATGGAVSRAAQPVTITFWTTSTDRYADWVQQFEAQNPDVRVQAEYIGNYDQMAMKVQAAIAGRATPDVAQMGQRHGLPQVIDAGAVVPVDQYLSEADMADIRSGLWSRYTYRGRRWAVPFGASTPGLWYNRTAFRQAGLNPDHPPKTWDELIRAARVLTRDVDGDGRIDQWGFGTCADVPWYVRPMILQAGGALYGPDGQPRINSPEAVRVLRFFQEVVHRYRVSPPLAHRTAEKDFIGGRYAQLFCSMSVRAYYEREVGSRFELGLALFPGDGRQVVGLGGNALVLFRSTPERQAAGARLIRFLTDTARTVEMGVTTGYVAIRRSAMNDPALRQLLTQNPRARTIYNQLEWVGDAGVHPADGLLWDGLLKAVEQVQTDPAADPQAILDQLQRELSAYMAAY